VFYKIQGISELAEEFTTCQGLCSLELFSEMQTSYNGDDEHPSFSKCYAVSTGKVPSVHDITSQMTLIFMNTTSRTSNFTLYTPLLGSYSVTCLQIWEGNYSPVDTMQHPTRLTFFAYKHTHIYVQSHSIVIEKLKYGNTILKYIH